MSDEAPTLVSRDDLGVSDRLGEVPTPRQDVERDRVFSSLHDKMFGGGDEVRIGRFVLENKLGSGAMGVVYAARDPELDRRVALKLLRGPASDEQGGARLEREARALARLRHPNVVTVHEVGRSDSGRFIAMDLVEGPTLRKWLDEPRRWRAIVELFIEAGRGLHAAHEAGLVHRDFKLDNVLVENGHARVVDFGLARESERTVDVDVPDDLATDELTRSGTIVGTPAYMAPEAFGGECNARADQFSFCVSLYEALYGVRPFSGDTMSALLGAMLGGELQPATKRVAAPAWLRRAVLRGLCYDPDERWPDMAALVTELERVRRRPLSRWLALAGLGGTAVGAVVVSVADADGPTCIRGAERVEQVWNGKRAKGIAKAFEDTGLPFAPKTWAKVRANLDDYALSWKRQRVEACQATWERGEQSEAMFDARMLCLDRHLQELDALAAAFEDPNEKVVTRAVVATRGLAPLSQCADEVVLARRLSGAQDRVEAPPELYATLARARAAKHVGRYPEAIELATALATEADEQGDLALASEALWTLASVEDRSGRQDVAEAKLLDAIERAERLGDDRLRATAQTLLVSVLAKGREAERARRWARLTRATLDRLGGEQELVATLVHHEGNVLEAEGRYEESIAKRREALALSLEYLEPDDPRLATNYSGLASVLLGAGRNEEALEAYRRNLELLVAGHGEHHPLVARGHQRVAGALESLGRLDEAAEEVQKAIDVSIAALGPAHLDVAAAYVTLANTVAQSAKPQASIPHYQEALKILEGVQGPDGYDVGVVLANLGRVYALSGQPREAMEVLTRSLTIHETTLGPDHPDLLYALGNLAAAQARLERYAEAAVTGRRAVKIGIASLGEHHPMVAESWLRVGEAHRMLKDADAAIEALRSAVEAFEKSDARTASTARARVELARAYMLRPDREAAIAMLKQAREEFVADPTDHPNWLRNIDAWVVDPSDIASAPPD